MKQRFTNVLRSYIPDFARPFVRSVRRSLRKIYYIPIDLWSTIRGRDDLTPPPSLDFVGGGDFRQTGEEFANYFTKLAGLMPGHSVLDVGCGIGRMAGPLTKYLSRAGVAGGSYLGFDIVKEGIDWATKHITSRYPDFKFVLADIYNKGYNPKGLLPASEYRFPAGDESFDFVFATSVLTHLLPEDAEHYVQEISRVLRRGGRCLITYFLLNDDSLLLIDRGNSTLDFRFPLAHGVLTIDKDVPENAVAYPESLIRETFRSVHLEIDEPIHYGFWCGREIYLSKQDIVIAHKTH